MNRKAHVIRKNKNVEEKRYWIFFDTESEIFEKTIDYERHILKLGYTMYYDLKRSKNPLSTLVFYKPSEFADFLTSFCYPRTCINVMSHNLAFDVAVSGIVYELKNRGWNLIRLFYSDSVTILKYRKNTSSILFLDFFNYIKTSVKDIGQIVGLNKIDIDFENCSKEELVEYCMRDTEIIAKAFIHFLDFIKEHDLGNLGVTISNCAFNAFRHRFMKHRIFVHNLEKAQLLERGSYFGGRNECFFIGYFPHDVFYLDVNSMFPFIMKYYPVPIRLWRYGEYDLDKSTLKNYLEDFCIIAEVILKTEDALYPMKMGDKTIYPVGKFRTILCTESLKYAIENDHIVEIIKYAIYEKEVVFKEYVDYFYDLKTKYTSEKNAVYRDIAKLYLNCLYGKFGQKLIKVKYIGSIDKKEISILPVYDEDFNKLYNEINFLGDIFHITESNQDSYNAFCAIASHVTDYARVYLFKLMKIAGKRNVLYCDTDSLFVTESGFRNLNSYIDRNEIGLLRVIDSAKNITIHACKDYKLNDKVRMKGISKKAIQISESKFRQVHFPSLAGLLRESDFQSVMIKHIVKELQRNYDKGIVTKSGWVRPYRFHSIG